MGTRNLNGLIDAKMSGLLPAALVVNINFIARRSLLSCEMKGLLQSRTDIEPDTYLGF